MAYAFRSPNHKIHLVDVSAQLTFLTFALNKVGQRTNVLKVSCERLVIIPLIIEAQVADGGVCRVSKLNDIVLLKDEFLMMLISTR
jgi:hypothetical protein